MVAKPVKIGFDLVLRDKIMVQIMLYEYHKTFKMTLCITFIEVIQNESLKGMVSY